MLLQSPRNYTCLATRLGPSMPQWKALRPLWLAFAMRPRHAGSQWGKATVAKSNANGSTLSARHRSMSQLSSTCLADVPSLRQRAHIDSCIHNLRQFSHDLNCCAVATSAQLMRPAPNRFGALLQGWPWYVHAARKHRGDPNYLRFMSTSRWTAHLFSVVRLPGRSGNPSLQPNCGWAMSQ